MATHMYQAALAGDVPLLFNIIQDDPTSIHPVQPTSVGDTIAHIAALLGHAEFIKEIVSRNPLLAREVNQQGYSPLHLASDKGQVGVVEEILTAGKDLCLIRDKDGKLAVHVAAQAGKLNVLEKLMEVDPECLERLTARDETVLHVAVKANQMQVVQYLAETSNYSELLNMKDDKGDTALHFASARRSKEMTRFLLSSKGIEVNAENKKGETPLGVILSLLPQGGGAAEEVNDIIRTAGGLPTNPRSVVEIGLAASGTSPPPPAATEETEESDAQWLKDMRKSLMVVAALIATITFEAGSSKRDENSKESVASAPSVNYNDKLPSSYNLSLDREYIAFRLFDMISLFSSLTVILLLLTKFPVKKKYLVVFLSKIMHLSIFSVGSAFLLLAGAYSEGKHVKETLIIGIFWVGWSYLTCYAVVSRLALAAGYFARRLGLKKMMMPKSKFVASLFKGLRVLLSFSFALVLFYFLHLSTNL